MDNHLGRLLARVLYDALTLYMLLLLVRWAGSRLQLDLYSRRLRWIPRLTDPLVNALRRRLPNLGPMDLAPLAAVLVVALATLTLNAGYLRRMLATDGWYEPPGVVVLGQALVVTVATGRNGVPQIEKFFAEAGVTHLAALRDPKSELAHSLGVMGLPVTLILNPEGAEVGRLMGDAEWDSPEARAVLTALMAP